MLSEPKLICLVVHQVRRLLGVVKACMQKTPESVDRVILRRAAHSLAELSKSGKSGCLGQSRYLHNAASDMPEHMLQRRMWMLWLPREVSITLFPCSRSFLLQPQKAKIAGMLTLMCAAGKSDMAMLLTSTDCLLQQRRCREGVLLHPWSARHQARASAQHC